MSESNVFSVDKATISSAVVVVSYIAYETDIYYMKMSVMSRHISS